ncbi:cysteine-rich CWC family protein [uncultured Oxalicibacterium sp.]|uniref:cysteine-rich CWC family protein n=1 Tax=uncultured Oxalicibacterium sp. TaxID=1168540 RepID=UPI0025F87438|nr:cysteine-rich CWC family protein [uncultured Oxalicibacterium sp.]
MSACPVCHTSFECGVVDGQEAASCWCMALPRPTQTRERKREIDPQAGCLCPACLQALRERQKKED